MVGQLIMLPVRVGVRATRLWLRAAEETVGVAVSATSRLVGVTSRGSGQGAESQPAEPRRNGRSDFDAPSRAGSASASASATADRPTTPPTSPATPPTSPATPPTGPATPPSPPTSPANRSCAPAEPDSLRDMMGDGEPAHVSEEPTLVEEFAEPGAEDGAGAQIHVEEPWDGYAHMNAKQIVGRLGSATPAELAAVQLYEGANRRRQTVLNAVQRELRSANGRSSGSQQRG